jgi:hypothetical protein
VSERRDEAACREGLSDEWPVKKDQPGAGDAILSLELRLDGGRILLGTSI